MRPDQRAEFSKMVHDKRFDVAREAASMVDKIAMTIPRPYQPPWGCLFDEVTEFTIDYDAQIVVQVQVRLPGWEEQHRRTVELAREHQEDDSE